MKTITTIFTFTIVALLTTCLRGQTDFIVSATNGVLVDDFNYEFDIHILSTGTEPLELATFQTSIYFNDAIRDSGSLSAVFISGTSTLSNSNQYPNPPNLNYINNDGTIRQLRIAPRTPPGSTNGSLISNVTPGTRFGRFRITNTMVFNKTTPVNWQWNFTTGLDQYPSSINAYIDSVNTNISGPLKFNINLDDTLSSTSTPTIPYFGDFEGFTTGQQVACQDPLDWTTWSNLPCSSEDAYISSTFAYSGSKSVKIIQNNDLVKPLLAQTSGKWFISFMNYIPTGKTGYFNTLALFAGGSSNWGMECYFSAGGAGSLNAGSVTPTTFTWIPDSWKKVEVIVDLDLNLAEFWYNNTMVKSWQWTLGAFGSGSPLKLDANDFFGATANDEMYFDDYKIEQINNTFQLSVNITNGWNIVSIPGLHPTDQNVSTWWAFRDLGANVFRYAGGYQSVTSAVPGTGYWMKHAGARTYNTGDEWPTGGINVVPHVPLIAASGWNLFGGYELVVTAANVTTNPSGQQSGPIYKYSGGYQVATTLDPGYGYWIKLLSAAQIIIPETMAKGEAVEYFAEDWGRIILTDATGINYTLYAVKGEVNLDNYELPPAPPAGMFDIRFSSGRIAEDINSSVKTIDMSGVTYPLTVRVEGMDIRLMDETGKTINVNLKAGEDIVISDASVMKLMVSGELIPAQYALEQNYPNPFNPSTVIEFSLPEDVSNVKLSIYNALGEKVAELVNTALVAGKYQYQWNAKNVATGMYIYEIRADEFVAVRKMLLIK